MPAIIEEASPREPRAGTARWAWRPALPVGNSPLFSWPPRPLGALEWFLLPRRMLSARVPLAALAVVTWFALQPDLARCATLEADWILAMFARNLCLMLLVAGGLHLYLYAFARQGRARKYMAQELARSDPRFSWNDQTRDNMGWTLASGVTLWTAYEAALMWAYANEAIPLLQWRDNPVWFVLLFFFIALFNSTHFYFVHRFLHSRVMYRKVHRIHHRNVNTGPWSGISMHPIEHLVYFSSVLVHWVVASHPIHVFYHMQYLTLEAAAAHCGFNSLVVRGRDRVSLGSFFHQLHHRHFDCNYGNGEVPWDKWLGTWHDGTEEGMRGIRRRRERKWSGAQ